MHANSHAGFRRGFPGAWLAGLASALVLAASASPATAQATGSIVGRVIDHRTGNHLASAAVIAPEAGARTETTEDGTFLLADLAPGTVHLRIEAPGFTHAVEAVQVHESTTSLVEIRVLPMDAVLSEILAVGRRRAGDPPRTTSETLLRLEETEEGLTVVELLRRRVPGLRLGPGSGNVGSGGAVLMRGVGSISGSQEPVIYLDGVRLGSGADGNPVRLLEEIPASAVTRIHVLRGPAAAAVHTNAAAGVILIETTRRAPEGGDGSL
jgi:TonB-dependent starch-binding outer membrane protein SusC